MGVGRAPSTADRGLQLVQFHANPQPSSSPRLFPSTQPLARSEQCVPGAPRGVPSVLHRAPLLCLAARKGPCDHPSIRRETLHLPFILDRVFPVSENPLTLLPSRDPRRGSDWESLSFFRLRRPSLHTAFTSGGALNSHNPILPQTLRDWHPAAFC